MGNMIVSLERAYHMFLAHDNNDQSGKLTKYEYIVYANFMRFGCHIRRFKNDNFITSNTSSEDENDADESVHTDASIQKSYIWNYLYELLGHRKTAITSGSIDTNRYNTIKESMNTTIGKFKVDDSFETNCTTETSLETISLPEKRKLQNNDNSNVSACKTVKLSSDKRSTNEQYFGSGSTNDFMIGSAFQRFKQIFTKIDVIDVKQPDSFDNEKPINEKFTFDLWAEMDNRYWNEHKGPDFRLIVR